jgi:hypothetical protein
MVGTGPSPPNLKKVLGVAGASRASFAGLGRGGGVSGSAWTAARPFILVYLIINATVNLCKPSKAYFILFYSPGIKGRAA